MRRQKKSHKLKVGRTGAYALAEAAGINRRHSVKPNGKKVESKRACRGRVRV